MSIFRYVYLMRKRGSTKCKIGIAKDPKRRRKQVDKAVRGNVYIVYTRPVMFARLVEKFLHSKFATLRFRLFWAGKGAGRTEWFHFFFWQRWLVIFWIGTFSLLPIFPLILFLLIYFYDDIAPAMELFLTWLTGI